MARPQPLTIIAELKNDDCVTQLREWFDPVGKNIDDNPYIRFHESRLTHFCRFALLPDDMPAKDDLQRPMKPHLLFATNYDGKLRDYLDELQAIMEPSFFDKVWGCCADYNGREDFYRFAQANDHKPGAYYIAFPDETVLDVQAKYHARRELRDQLDDPAEQQKFLASLQTRNPSLFQNISKALANIAGVAFAPLANLVFPENVDDVDPYSGVKTQLQRISSDYHQHVGDLAAIEDKAVQNQMNILSEVKPENQGRFGRLNRKLFFVTLAARLSPPGQLVGISTIHFARWVPFDDGRRMVFLSNYDGTWENYISDFTRKVAGGMDAVWSNTVDFPEGGPHDIAAFEQHIRDHQIPSLAFYSAYPRLTVSNRVANRWADALLNGRVMSDQLHEALHSL